MEMVFNNNKKGGVYTMAGMRRFKCYGCNHEWEIAYGLGRPDECPQCKNTNIHRAEQDRGYARSGRGGGFGYGCRRS